VIEQSKLTGSKTLAEHLTDWEADILARGRTKQHAELSAHRVTSLADACGFKFYSDISAAKVQKELSGRRKDTMDAKGKTIRGLSIQSTNFYLSCCKSFCRWMMHERRATSSPVEYLDGQNVATDKRHTRRMLNQSDFAKLLTAAQSGPERYGMTGAERALVYELAATTGLRASELASLTAGSLSLGESPSVTIAAKSAKNRKAAILPLRADMAVKLSAFTATKLPTAAVFARLDKFNAARIIRIDLKAAGIPYTDESGNVFDFHALRHQFISNLAAAGVHPKTAQELARHSDIKLTMNRYTHVFRGELDKAIDLLPDYAAEQARQSAQAAKTGTDDLPVNAVALPGQADTNPMARNGALLCDKQWRTVAPGSAMAMQGHGE
ncbi:MAG: tyrosine-type recombinase/integrase, partial [Phycisphaerae bacterium]